MPHPAKNLKKKNDAKQYLKFALYYSFLKFQNAILPWPKGQLEKSGQRWLALESQSTSGGGNPGTLQHGFNQKTDAEKKSTDDGEEGGGGGSEHGEDG